MGCSQLDVYLCWSRYEYSPIKLHSPCACVLDDIFEFWQLDDTRCQVFNSHDIAKDTMTSSNGNFSALLTLCEGNPPVTGGFPSQRPVPRSFDVFFDLRLNKRLSNRDASDLRHHRTHYDITVMKTIECGELQRMVMRSVSKRNTCLYKNWYSFHLATM